MRLENPSFSPNFARDYVVALTTNTINIIMANLRKIKKDIDFLISEVISDCYMFLSFHPEAKLQEAEGILLEAVNLRNDLYNRVNSAPSEGRKKHYIAISKDLLQGVDKLFGKVSGLSK
jgi:hypothetical protein